MLEKAVEYIRANPSTILWALIILTLVVVYMYYVNYIAKSDGMSSKRKKKKKKAVEDDDTSIDELPEPEETSASISKDRLAELSRL
jgi:hypothetical protein